MMDYSHKKPKMKPYSTSHFTMAKVRGHQVDGGDYLAGTVLGNERDISKPKGRHPRKKYGRTVMTG